MAEIQQDGEMPGGNALKSVADVDTSRAQASNCPDPNTCVNFPLHRTLM